MPEKTKHDHGTFSWADLQTSNIEGAKSFYTGLFGWEGEDMPAGEGVTYTMWRINGKYVAAGADLQPEPVQQGIPSHWNAYITVDDVDKITEQAKELGATVLAEPFDVLDVGRMSVLQDPTGATFCPWQGKTMAGAELVDEPGAITWFELATGDIKAAEKFYTELFGWTGESMPTGDFPYTMFTLGDKQVAGCYQLGEDAGPTPPNWTIYYRVSELDDAAAKVKELGGQVHVEPSPIPGFGRFSIISDPQGAVIGLYERSDQPAG